MGDFMKNDCPFFVSLNLKFFSLLIKFLILPFSLIFTNYAFSITPEDVWKAKKKAYLSLRKRRNHSDGDDRHWGGDMPSSYQEKTFKFDLPLLSTRRIVNVNEYNFLGFFEIWDTDFDIHFDKEFYRKFNFREAFHKSNNGDSKSRDIIISTFASEYIAYLMNNDVRFNDSEYKNPIPRFQRYNKYVTYIVTHVYNLWNQAYDYDIFLYNFYNSLPGKVFGNSQKTKNTLNSFDNPYKYPCRYNDNNCVKRWYTTKGEKLSVKSLVNQKRYLDKDDGWTNPLDWFGFHDQDEIDRINYKIRKKETIHHIVKVIHKVHENKHKLMNQLVWSVSKGDLRAYETITNILSLVVVAALVVAGPEIAAGGLAYELTAQGVPVVSTAGGVQIASLGTAIGIAGICLTAAIAVHQCHKSNVATETLIRGQEENMRKQEEAQKRDEEILRRQEKHLRKYHNSRPRGQLEP